MKFVKSLMMAAFISAAFSAWALEGTVVSVSGKVEVQDGSVWVELEEGDTVEKGAVISTGFKSQLVLSVKGTELTVGPLTRLTVEELLSTSDKDTTQLFIDSGTISADVNGEDGKRVGFKVRSPIATASVLGTKFKVTSSGKITVNRGLVSFGPAESSEPEVSTDTQDSVIAEIAGPAESSPASAESASSDTVAAAEPDSPSSVQAPSSPAENSVAESPAPAKKANAFTSTKEVGGVRGVPVAAGQASKANGLSGGNSNPRLEKASASAGGASSTVTLTSQEVSGTAGGALTHPVMPDNPVMPLAPSTGSVNFKFNYK